MCIQAGLVDTLVSVFMTGIVFLGWIFRIRIAYLCCKPSFWMVNNVQIRRICHRYFLFFIRSGRNVVRCIKPINFFYGGKSFYSLFRLGRCERLCQTFTDQKRHCSYSCFSSHILCSCRSYSRDEFFDNNNNKNKLIYKCQFQLRLSCCKGSCHPIPTHQ